MTSEPGSFAHHTLQVRVPAILQETIGLNAFPSEIRSALDELYDELIEGTIRGLREDAADRAFWDAVGAPWLGRSWLAVPWYWAEAYFYRRILEATRYFQPGPWHGFDPYAVKKRAASATHWFYTTSLFYFQLPGDLLAELANATLVIVKGDANYRRLLGDAHWPAMTPFAQAVSYFPAPVVALRTREGEIITGLAEGQAERLAAEDAAWLVNGQRGVIQTNKQKPGFSEKPGF